MVHSLKITAQPSPVNTRVMKTEDCRAKRYENLLSGYISGRCESFQAQRIFRQNWKERSIEDM